MWDSEINELADHAASDSFSYPHLQFSGDPEELVKQNCHAHLAEEIEICTYPLKIWIAEYKWCSVSTGILIYPDL